MLPIGQTELLLVLFVEIIVVFPFWRIVRKMGWPGSYSLLILIPLINVLLVYYLAFTAWPIEKKLGGYKE